MDTIYRSLCEIAGSQNVLENEDMSRHVTFKAGGRAKYFVTPASFDILAKIITYIRAEKINYYVIGNGSNLLVRDEGYDGVIVKVGSSMGEITVNQEKTEICCQAGAFVSKVANVARDYSLSGMEFAAGIPGMIGGAVAMNAGAYGGEFKDIIDSVWVLDEDGREICMRNEEMKFSYRTSVIQESRLIVTRVKLKLKSGDKNEISARMDELLRLRKEKQPLEYPSAGSTFKRPEGYFAGKLIMDCGLKGFCVGGAGVSEKHCGFVINKGNATATDIIELIHRVQEVVYERFGVKLETEVKIL